jgi:hypothetical protein
MHNILNWPPIIMGFLSGALWLCASIIKVPTNIGSGYGALVGDYRDCGVVLTNLAISAGPPPAREPITSAVILLGGTR